MSNPTATGTPGATGAAPDQALASVFGARPELWTRFQAFYDALWTTGTISRRVLEICRLRVAAIHGCTREWSSRTPDVFLSGAELDGLAQGDFAVFDHCEKSALAVTEKMPFQHHAITDDDVRALEDGYGAGAAVALLTALAFFDVRCRWQQTLLPETTPP